MDTNFIDKVTHVIASWLNPVNKAVYRAIGAGGVAPETPGEVRANLGLTAAGGAALVGNNPAGGSPGATVQEALDNKVDTAEMFDDPRHRWNEWDDEATLGYAQQHLEYDVTNSKIEGDRGGWTAVVEEASGTVQSVEITPLTVGNAYGIRSLGTTDFTAIGASSNTVGTTFIATGPGSGSGSVVNLEKMPIFAHARYVIASVGTTNFTSIGAPSNTVGTEFVTTGTIGTTVGTGTGLAQPMNRDNFTALTGHALHLGGWSGGAYWGVVTEAWSTQAGSAILIGGELACIQQNPAGPSENAASVGLNVVFKNRPDVFPNPTALSSDGGLYNKDSIAFYVTSQARPVPTAWKNVGSGWQTVIKVGDPGFGPGIDWEGGNYYDGTIPNPNKAHTTIVDMTDALYDLAGGIPWFTLYRNGETYWGTRFSGMVTGQLSNHNLIITAGGNGYAVGDEGTIAGSPYPATYVVSGETGGVVTQIVLRAPVRNNGGSGYTPGAKTTMVTTGGGNGLLALNVVLSTGSLYGADMSAVVLGSGYTVGTLFAIGGGAAGSKLVICRVTAVNGSGGVTGFRMLTGNLYSHGTHYPTGIHPTVIIGGAGDNLLTIFIDRVWKDLLIGGEKWEFWRMADPNDPYGTGARHGYVDASFPGKRETITDSGGDTFTFAPDGPL